MDSGQKEIEMGSECDFCTSRATYSLKGYLCCDDPGCEQLARLDTDMLPINLPEGD